MTTKQNVNDLFENYIEFLKKEEIKEHSINIYKRFTWLAEQDYTNLSTNDIEDILTKQNITSFSMFVYQFRALSLYLKYVGNENLYIEMMKLEEDLNTLWLKVKPSTSKKYISYNDYLLICKDIDMNEEYNELYQLTLFQSIYEGIYCGDFSVIYNLRASDIDIEHSIVTLKNNNNEVYTIPISSDLANNLIALSREPYWYSRNRNCDRCEHKLYGDYPDSCFKIASRNGKYENRNSAYMRIIKSISNKYTDKQLTSKSIFISGLIKFIKDELNKYNISLEDALSHWCTNKTVHKVITEICEQYHYGKSEKSTLRLRRLLKGYAEEFK